MHMGRYPRFVGGVYRVGQMISAEPPLTAWTAYNRNSGDVVGLQIIELPPTLENARLQALLRPLEQRRLVRSQHVLPLHDWGIDQRLLYMVTDPPRGLTLRHVMDHENIDLQRALEMVRQLLRGVEALHACGIYGLDLRPQLITVNIIEVQDEMQIDDLGLRSLLQGLGYTGHQQSGAVAFFDPRYLAPEYIQGQPCGPWTDVYHVALLLFELVTGRFPFVGRTLAETGLLQMSARAPRMELYHHNVPTILQEVVDRALAKEPRARFLSPRALLNALEAIEIPPPPERVPAFGEVTLLASPEQEAEPAKGTPGEITDSPRETAAEEIPGSTPDTRADQAPSGALTREMAALDLALEETLLEHTGKEGSEAFKKAAAAAPEGQEEGVYAYLCFEMADRSERRFPIKARDVVVGRADPRRQRYPDIDLTPVDPRMIVSRQHARIRFDEALFYIEDLKSHNGTWLGELRLVPFKAELLQHGDRVRFGSLECIFRLPGAPQSAPTPRKVEEEPPQSS
jgi:serine/threonine protein kinase